MLIKANINARIKATNINIMNIQET